MITRLTIQNYALIGKISMDFPAGFTALTGETGAGKSVLLGALSLICGNRADTNILRQKDQKCVVEATFDASRYSIKMFYDRNDIDYDEQTIIRREILPGGRSRSFVNDTPVTLNLLKELSRKLIDIHSQHQNLLLHNKDFQLSVLDSFAGLDQEKKTCSETYRKFLRAEKDLKNLEEKAQQARKEQDFLQFQQDELEALNLSEGEQEELEAESDALTHAEEIQTGFGTVSSLLSEEEIGILELLHRAGQTLGQIEKVSPRAKEFAERIEHCRIELQDIASETESLAENTENDPLRNEEIRLRLDKIYTLQNKHKVETVKDLLRIQEELNQKLAEIDGSDTRIEELTRTIDTLKKELTEQSEILTQARKEAIPDFEENIKQIIRKLGMPHAQFCVSIEPLNAFCETGADAVHYLFSANKHGTPQDIASVASGGEISRLMLAVKSVIADSEALPSIVFDEIDTGVSGEIADKIGEIMRDMSRSMQVLSVTHLPQVAAHADFHYKVFKEEGESETRTGLKKLSDKERLYEIAGMLSGADLTQAALDNASALLKK